MPHVPVDLGFVSADAECVEVHFVGGDLVLAFVGYDEVPRRHVFHDVLAFRFQELDDEPSLRDDCSYEVVGSPWLARQCALQAVPAADYAHYLLCFNACGALDVLCRRQSPR